jgi:hypothetical protein
MMKPENIPFDAYMENLIQHMIQNNQKSSADIYIGAWKRMRLCFGNTPILLSDVNPEWVSFFKAYLMKSGLSANTVNTYLNMLRIVYKKAALASNMENKPRPFLHAQLTVKKEYREASVAGIIKRMSHIRLDENQYLCFSRDLILFSLMAGKMSFRDMAFLKKTDICRGYLHYTRSRSGCQYTVLLTPAMKSIIHTYQGQSIYLFPIIHHPDKEVYRQYRSGLRKYNIHLNKLAVILNIQTPLGKINTLEKNIEQRPHSRVRNTSGFQSGIIVKSLNTLSALDFTSHI